MPRALYCLVSWGRSNWENHASRPRGAQGQFTPANQCKPMPRGNCPRKERPWGSTHTRFLVDHLKKGGKAAKAKKGKVRQRGRDSRGPWSSASKTVASARREREQSDSKLACCQVALSLGVAAPRTKSSHRYFSNAIQYPWSSSPIAESLLSKHSAVSSRPEP